MRRLTARLPPSLSSKSMILVRHCTSQTKPNASSRAWTTTRTYLRDIWMLPPAVGLGVVALLQYRRNVQEDTQHQQQQSLLSSTSSSTQTQEGTTSDTPPPCSARSTLASDKQMQAVRLFPYRCASRLWGMIHDIPLPMWAREPLYNAWTYVYGCNLDEMQEPLSSFRNLGEFFARHLKDNARTIARDPNVILTSPVDGKVMSCGIVSFDTASTRPTLDQIKGISYDVETFLGHPMPSSEKVASSLPSLNDSTQETTTTERSPSSSSQWYYITLYLAPGDYHRIHAPADVAVASRVHFPGCLYPVNKPAVKFIPSLFNVNERVVLSGSWCFGTFHLVAVGATNVGSIALAAEPAFKTNVSGQGNVQAIARTRQYSPMHLVPRGEEVAAFHLGSTVVLVFEAPRDFHFTTAPDQRVWMGQALGQRGSEASLSETPMSSQSGTTFPKALSIIRMATEKGSATLNLSKLNKDLVKARPLTSELSRTMSGALKEAVTSTGKLPSLKETEGHVQATYAALGPAYDSKPKK